MAQNNPSNLLYKIRTKKIYYLLELFFKKFLNVTVPPKMGQKSVFSGQSTTLEVTKKNFGAQIL